MRVESVEQGESADRSESAAALVAEAEVARVAAEQGESATALDA